MRCPVDRSELTPVEYEGCLIHTCETCGGELVSGASLAHIVETREQVFGQDVQTLINDHEPIFASPADDGDRAMNCPCCNVQMHPLNYAGDTAVLVERCTLCGGIWLDQHELELIQSLLEHWQDTAPTQLGTIAHQLEHARTEAARATSNGFAGSRFTFVNAVINRLLDAA